VSVIDLLGWLAAVFSATLSLPQAVRTAVTGSVAGLSQVTWQMATIAGMAWAGHGVVVGVPQLLWPNVVMVVTSGVVLAQITVKRRLPVVRVWAPVFALGALAIGCDVVLGPVAFAVLAFIPGAVGQLTQLRDTRNAADTSGISMVGLLMQFFTQVAWLSYALPAGELAVICVATPMGVLALANVLALQVRRRVAPVREPVAV